MDDLEDTVEIHTPKSECHELGGVLGTSEASCLGERNEIARLDAILSKYVKQAPASIRKKVLASSRSPIRSSMKVPDAEVTEAMGGTQDEWVAKI